MSTLRIKVVPGSSRNKVNGWLGEALKVRVTAKPEKGQANDAVIALLAETLGIPNKDISIIRGASSPQKILKINGLSAADIRTRLGGSDAG